MWFISGLVDLKDQLSYLTIQFRVQVQLEIKHTVIQFDTVNVSEPSKNLQAQSWAVPNKKIEIRDRTISKFIQED